jgi:hypothetical protein
VPFRKRQPHFYDEVVLSRVQLEMKIGNRERTDIIVFRADRPVTLTCYPAGPADVVQRVSPEDVEAAIEIKAAPSRAPKNNAVWERGDFARDIVKLSKLQKTAPHIRCFFVLLDKSVSVTGARSSEPPDESWRSGLDKVPAPPPKHSSRLGIY